MIEYKFGEFDSKEDNPILLLANPNNWPDKSMWYVPKECDKIELYLSNSLPRKVDEQ